MPECIKCHEHFPYEVAIDGKRRSLTRRKFCLKCSPFGQHNTRDITKCPVLEKKCPRCNETKARTEFYNRRGGIGVTSYCKGCLAEQSNERILQFKRAASNYKGGKCEVCGYDKCLAALDFHHVDGKDKDFNISQRRRSANIEAIKDELDKCRLLCSNCHREAHAVASWFKDVSPLAEFVTDKILEPALCVNCKVQVTRGAARCNQCASASREKIEWITTEELMKRVQTSSYESVARDLGVSSTAIRKRLRAKGLTPPRKVN